MRSLTWFVRHTKCGRGLVLALVVLMIQSIYAPLLQAQESKISQLNARGTVAPLRSGRVETDRNVDQELDALVKRVDELQAMQLQLIGLIGVLTKRQDPPSPPPAEKIAAIADKEVRSKLTSANEKVQQLQQANITHETGKSEVDAVVRNAEQAKDDITSAVTISTKRFREALQKCNTVDFSKVFTSDLPDACVQAALARVKGAGSNADAQLKVFQALSSNGPGAELAALWGGESATVQATIVDAFTECAQLPECLKEVGAAASDLVRTIETARSQAEVISHILMMAMATGNPYIMAAAAVIAVILAILDSGSGKGEGDGPGKGKDQGTNSGQGNEVVTRPGPSVGENKSPGTINGVTPPGTVSDPGRQAVPQPPGTTSSPSGKLPPGFKPGNSEFEVDVDIEIATITITSQKTGAETARLEFKKATSNVDGKTRIVDIQTLQGAQVMADGTGITFEGLEVRGEGLRKGKMYFSDGSTILVLQE